MASKRFPGKVLSPLLGKPTLLHVVDRIILSKFNLKIILATSDNDTDDPLAEYAKYIGIEVVRGPLNDVINRFVVTLNKYKSEAFFRVCGDSPFLSPLLFDRAINLYNQGNYDLVTNLLPRSFPPGMSIELIKTKTFMETENKINKSEDREHVTKYFYENNKVFKIYNIKCKKIIDTNFKLTIDTLEDSEKLEVWEKNRKENQEDLFPILI